MFIHGFVELELRARFAGERRLSNVPGPACLLAITCNLAESSFPRPNFGNSRRELSSKSTTSFKMIHEESSYHVFELSGGLVPLRSIQSFKSRSKLYQWPLYSLCSYLWRVASGRVIEGNVP